MSWVNDLASGLGIPGGAAVLAGAMYAACAAAEKAARPEALRDIGRILKDTSWERSVRPSALIHRLFVWTFGERHLSWKCVARSLTATLFMFFSAFVMLILIERPPVLNWPADTRNAFSVGFAIMTLGAFPDYMSLWKTRILLSLVWRCSGSTMMIVIVCLDVCISLCVSIFLIAFFASGQKIDAMGEEAWNVLHAVGHPGDLNAVVAFPLSALFTSVWTTLILLSTTVLKLLAPLHRFTAWFFDVEKHPVQAIGIIAGALVMIGSLLSTVLRAVI